MSRKGLDSVLSAIVLVAYAVVWIIGFIMNATGTSASGGFAGAIGIVKTIMQVFVYVVLLYNAWQIRGGLIYKIIIAVVTVWLIFCAVSVHIPAIVPLA